MGLEASLFQPNKSPARQASLRAFLGSRLAGSPAPVEKALPSPYPMPGQGRGHGLPLGQAAAKQAPPAAMAAAAGAPPSVTNAVNSAGANTTPTPAQLDQVTPSYSYDPILQQIMSVTGWDDAAAKNAALEGRRNVLLDYGDKELAAKLLGGGDPTVAAINDDPEKSMSTLARISRAYRAAVKTNEDQLNEGNLFYGGYRGSVLSDLAKQKLEQTTDASRQVQDALKQIGDALLAKQTDIRDRLLAAKEQAFRDRINNLPPGWTLDPNGNPIPPPGYVPPNNNPKPPSFKTPDGDEVSFTPETTNPHPGMTWENATWLGTWVGDYGWDTGHFEWKRKDGTSSSDGYDNGYGDY